MRNTLKIIFVTLFLGLITFFSFELIDFDKHDISSNVAEDYIIKDFKPEEIVEGFKKIRMGMNLNSVKTLIGEADRVDSSVYGFEWHVYNQYKNIFFMIGVEKNKVVGIYSNTMYHNYLNEIELDKTDKTYIENNYKVEDIDEKEYDIIRSKWYDTTLFYDIHNNNKITSYEIVNLKHVLKRNLSFFHTAFIQESNTYTNGLERDFELQLFDLINASREKFGLDRLEYDPGRASRSSNKHALDMMRKNYFNHNNLEGETPFDRMIKEGINYSFAGENLAGGHLNAIRAHEALMNSKGHRDIILNPGFKNVGLGVKFGGEMHTYYVQNYYSED